MGTMLDQGIELLDSTAGEGTAARKGDTLVYNARLFLRRGDEVTTYFKSIEAHAEHLPTRMVNGVRLVDHVTTLGRRQPIAAVEKSLHGMQAGGYREVLAGAHLCYGTAGVPGRVPANAMLRIQLWVRSIEAAPDTETPTSRN